MQVSKQLLAAQQRLGRLYSDQETDRVTLKARDQTYWPH